MAKRAAGFVIFRSLNGNLEYLLLRASYGDKHWTPPKGHVDPGESDWETALRETREEAGFNETDLQVFKDITTTLSYKVRGNDKTSVYWLAKLIEPQTEVKLSDEHTEYRWLGVTEAAKLCGFKDFADMLNEFHLKVQNQI